MVAALLGATGDQARQRRAAEQLRYRINGDGGRQGVGGIERVYNAADWIKMHLGPMKTAR